MIDKDLELLGVVKHLSTSMPSLVVRLLDDMRDGSLPADKLRELAGIARDLADALQVRADEIDPAPAHVEWPDIVEGSTSDAPE